MKNHRQTLDKALGIQKRKRKYYRDQRSQGHHKEAHKNLLTCANRGLQRLNRQGRPHGSNGGSLLICYDCTVWSSVGLLIVGAGDVSYSFTGFWDPDSHTGLLCPSLIPKEVLSITAT